MSKFFFKATHSSGRVHLRSSTSNDYAWATVSNRRGHNSFHSRIDLAQAEAGRDGMSLREVVRAEPITKAEHDAILKAGKRGFKVKFLGKVYTKTISAEADYEYTYCVGYDRPEIKDWVAQPQAKLQGWLDDALAHGYSSEERIAKLRENLAAGGWFNTYRAERGVWWFESKAKAEEFIESTLRSRLPLKREWYVVLPVQA